MKARIKKSAIDCFLRDRIKNISYILMLLIFSSIEKIDIISNAMILRGFGKRKKRTYAEIEDNIYSTLLIYKAGFTHGLAEGRQAGVPAGAEERFPGGWGPGGVGDPDRGHPHGGAVGGPGATGGSRFGARAQFLQGGLRGRTQEI